MVCYAIPKDKQMITQQIHGMWNIKPDNQKIRLEKKDLKVRFPGDIHSALIEQKIIPDPYFGKNELDIQWVGKTDWICEKEFIVKKNFMQGQQFIELDMVDTYVHIFINNQEIGFCNNFFKKWRFPIKDAIKEGNNTIKLVFESAEKNAIKAALKYPYSVPCIYYDIFSPNRNFSRKPQCHSGWDWGPCIMAFGIYSSIQLVQTTKGFIDYVETKSEKHKNDWTVEINTHYTALGNLSIPFSVQLMGPGVEPVIAEKIVKVTKGENQITQSVKVKNPELWYPVGCSPKDDESILKTGKPAFLDNPLYALSVKAADSSMQKKIAFRTLETVTEEDTDGRSLYFKINGRPVFSKGSNWIPMDALPSRMTEKRYEYLLDSLIKANTNTVRIWGGGMYEKDYFYEFCDRKGILIWQDFMFACSLYPTNKEFLESVRTEVRHQVLRLKDHPSIALWCGNNENLGAINWFPETKKNRDVYLIDYDKLNEGVIGDEVKKNDPDRMWWPSSPCAGPNTFTDNWKEDSKGDMHYWEVWHGKKSFDSYYDIKPRFVSEFGYQSFPSYSTVQSYTEKKDLNLTSPVMEFHQRSSNGNTTIIENFARYFRFPKTIQNMLYLSQVQQSIAMRMAIDYWRSLKPFCMGSIIWQLNDNCPVASWSSIEYNGKWKLMHYDAINFFSPVGLSLYIKDKTLYAYGLNDTQKDIESVLTLSFIAFDGKKAQKDFLIQKNILKDSSIALYSCKIDKIPLETNTYFIYGALSYSGGTIHSTAFPDVYKHCELLESELTYETVEKITSDGPIFELLLSTKNPAFFVGLDAGSVKGIFSENLITLLPEEKKVIYFTPENKRTSIKKFTKELTVTDLRSTY